jgi:signal transduction histidine kinase
MLMKTNFFQFLRNVPLFADLPDSNLAEMCGHVEEVHLKAGDILFTEGSPGGQAYVIQEGQIEIFTQFAGRKVSLAVRQPGEVIGEISLLESSPRTASGQAITDCSLISIDHELLDGLLNTSPSAARTMLKTIVMRLQSTEATLLQSKKMAQLGTFTAGIAHELNNPSSSVQRGSEQLKSCFREHQAALFEIRSLQLTTEQAARLQSLGEQVLQRARSETELNPIDRLDRELELEGWFEIQGWDNWDLIPTLANLGFDRSNLQEIASAFPAQALPMIMKWLTLEFETYRLLEEIHQGAGRISEIIQALKSYVYLDQAPTQEIDIHDGLKNTLVILRHKLKQGVDVKTEFSTDVPRLTAYGSELNQVWTNLIDNSIDAMNGSGRLTLRTRYQEPWVVVEIEDTGAGIPAEVLPRLFDPFFTTKPVGKGTGLGLNISYKIIQKHGGDIKVHSQPGLTRFEVFLPTNEERSAARTEEK